MREERVWPGLDDKRLTAWNALMIAALADAGAVLERPDYVDAAAGCAEFVLRDLRDDDGRLLRTWKDGEAKLNAYLQDHAFLLEALLVLYEATFDPRWFAAARELADTMIERFADAERGGFFETSDDHEQLVARRKDLEDNPIPSGNSSAASACCGWPRSPASTPTRSTRSASSGCCTSCCRSTRRRSRTCSRRSTSTSRPSRRSRSPATTTRARSSASCARGSARTWCSPAERPDGVPLLEGREPGRRAGGGLRLRALRLPAPGDRAGRARSAADA